MDRVTWSRISSWTLGIGVSFWRRSCPMLLHTEYAEVSDVGANPLLPVKVRLKPALQLFTRRFEAQLHWWPVRVICTAPFGRGIPAGCVAPPSNTPVAPCASLRLFQQERLPALLRDRH